MGATEVNKADFFRYFRGFWEKTFQLYVVQSAFRKTGLIPLDRSYAYKKLKLYQAK